MPAAQRSADRRAPSALARQGADDPVVSPHGVREWREETSGRSSITWYPGGHFFHTDPESLRTTLRPLVARMLAQ